ncbi:hypothetical protein D2Q93_15790 [Alicyclobacillaceae bacterium I2511]|nr:hypothetical protein D2Q93_15790 [Alicyclobacillaceae bacterium I2511]
MGVEVCLPTRWELHLPMSICAPNRTGYVFSGHIFMTRPGRQQELLEEVQKAQSYGISTICDPTVMGLGRDIHFMENIVEQTGIQLVAATGLYTYHDIPHFFENRSIDFMSDLFVHDIEEGIQGSDTRAGIIKFATDEPGITPAIQKVISAGARAHRRTGVPIITHSHAHNGSGAEQQRLLEAEGVDLRRVVIGHAGDTDDIEYLVQLLERGSFIGLDRYQTRSKAPHFSAGDKGARREANVLFFLNR